MKTVVLGFGVMGRQISSLLCLLGYSVIIWSYKEKEDDEKQINRHIKLLKKQFKIEQKKINYSFTYNIRALPQAVYIECIKEDLFLKQELYKKVLSKAVSYFSNTSSYKLIEIGKEVNGLHFFNPISMKLLEHKIVDDKSDFHNSLFDELKALDFTLVAVEDNRGFIANYILFNEIAMIFKLIEKYKYNSGNIKSICKKLYDERNIFQIIDIVGVDITLKIIENLAEEDTTIYIPTLLKEAINNNIYGKKTEQLLWIF